MDENKRIKFHNELKSIMPSGSENNVYFQAPSNMQMKFPCIKYEIDRVQTRKADNVLYKLDVGMNVTYITKDPTDYTYEKILKQFPMSTFNRRFINDGMYHHTFVIYY